MSLTDEANAAFLYRSVGRQVEVLELEFVFLGGGFIGPLRPGAYIGDARVQGRVVPFERSAFLEACAE